MCQRLFSGFISITIMMHIGMKLFYLTWYTVKTFVNRIDEMDIRFQPNHSSHCKVSIYGASQIQIVTLYIGRQSVFLIGARFEKVYYLRYILKPLIIIQKKEPLSFCPLKSYIAGLGKIPAPLKINDMVCVLLNNAPYLFSTSCIC